MTRQSISFTKPNDEWLKAQVESQEYSSKSEVINDLIRKARQKQEEIEWIRAKLVEAEKSGFTDMNRDQILAQSKEQRRQVIRRAFVSKLPLECSVLPSTALHLQLAGGVHLVWTETRTDLVEYKMLLQASHRGVRRTL